MVWLLQELSLGLMGGGALPCCSHKTVLWSIYLGKYIPSLSLHIRLLGLSDEDHTFRASFGLVYLLQVFYPNTVTLEVRA